MAGSTTKKVAIVIPTWKRMDLLQKCLQSIEQQTVRDHETIVVSNGAAEWTARLAETAGCTVLDLPSNLGFAAGVNAGLAHGNSPYVLVLNDDVELDPKWLELTVSFLDKHPESSYCCGKIYQAGGALLDNAGDALSLGGSAWRLGFGRPASAEFDVPRPIWAVSGTATLFRRTVFQEIGTFDEDFFAYLEDMDFSLRAARAGFQGFYLPEAVSHHRGSATLGPESPEVIRLLTRNQLILLAKHYPVSLLLRLAPRISWTQSLWLLRAIWNRRFGAYLMGLMGFLRLLSSSIRKRTGWSREASQALLDRLVISDREIFADIHAADRAERGRLLRMYFALFPPQGKRETAQQGLRTAL